MIYNNYVVDDGEYKMNLIKYDNRFIRLVDGLGDIYEGVARYDSRDYNLHEYGKEEESIHSRDYNLHEYGKEEESIQMSHTIFFKSFIKKIEIIDSFSDKYGLLEESIIDLGMDMVDEILTSEEDVSINRLLLCLEDKIKTLSKNDIDELLKSLDVFIKYNNNENNVKEAIEIKNML